MIPIPTLPGVVHEGQMTYESLRTLANQAFGKNDVFIGSGPTHRVGLVPDPGKDAGTAKYLCEDGTWTTVTASLVGGVALQAATPGVAQVGNANITGTMIATTFIGDLTGNATTSSDGLTSATGTTPLTLTLAAKALTGSVAVMTGDAGAGGTKGLVPDQAIGDATKFLRGDATWQTVSTAAVTSISAGAGITLTPDPIVATGSVALTSPVVVTLGGTGTTTQFTPGSVVFAGVAGVYTEDNANFFWNNATKCLGIDTAVPLYPLSLGSSTGNKIALYETGGGAGYGFGIQANLLQVFCDLVTDRVGIGYGNSGAFTETLTVKGSRVGIGATSPGASLDVATKFYVDSNGNITKTNNVTTSWPGLNAVGVLTNDGAGNFSWASAAAATIVVADTSDATCWIAMFEDATGTMAIKTDGNLLYDANAGALGIGVAPSYRLHAYKTQGTTGTDFTLGMFNTVRSAADAGAVDKAIIGSATATNAAGTFGTLIGVAGDTSATTGGTVTNSYSFYASGSFSVGSVLTNRAGLYVAELTFAGGGSCATQYGIKIETLAAGSTNYSIYTGTAKTYLGGALDVAAAKFQVDTNGDIVKLRNVTTTFPNANSTGLLANDGAGTLSWTGTLSGLGFSVATPTGAVNGVNKVYTLATAPVAGNYVILIDGQVVVEPADYAIAGVTLTVDAARAAPTMWIRILYGGGGSYSPAGSAASQHDNFTGDGLNDTFTFSATALADGIIYVSINGAIVDSGDYTYTTTDITFNVAPLLGDDIGVGYYTSSGISGNPAIDTYAAVAAQTDFTLAHGAAAINVVSVNGLVLTSAGWTFYRPTTITLTSACIGGEVVQVSYIY